MRNAVDKSAHSAGGGEGRVVRVGSDIGKGESEGCVPGWV